MAAFLKLIAHVRAVDKLVILIDEAETLQDASESDLSCLARFFRALIDVESEKLCIIIATSVTADTLFADMQALLRRIHMTIKLTPLDDISVKQLVRDYLKAVLKDRYTPPYGVFSEEAIEVLGKASRGHISSLITLLSYVYDRCIQENITTLDSEKAQEYVEDARNLSLIKD
jgi:type II secretory pathway predicted ATPase ExeA